MGITNKTYQYNIFVYLNLVFTLAYIAWGIIPVFARNSSNLVLFLIIFGWIVSALFSKPISQFKISKLALLIALWIVSLFLYFISMSGAVASGNFFNIVLYFFSFYIFIFYNKIGNQKFNNIMLWFTILAFTYTCIANIKILIDNPYASKYFIGSVEGIVDKYANSNLSSLSFIAFSTLFIPILIGLLSSYRKKYVKLLLASSILVGISFVIMASSSISLIVLFIEIILLLGVSIKNKGLNMIVYFIILILVTILIMTKDYIGRLLISMSYQVENLQYSIRLVEIGSSLSGISSSGSMSGRFQHAITSFDTFLSNPIIGKGMVFSSNFRETGIGMHSQLIDDMARYGLVGIIINIIIYTLFYRAVLKNANSLTKRKYVIIVVGGALLLALFNPFVGMTAGILVFLILPLYASANKERKKEYRNENIICSK